MRSLLTLLALISSPASADCLSRVSENVQANVAISILPEGLDPGIRELVWLVGARESRLNPDPGRGGAGEVGTFQILPRTAATYLEAGENLADPRVNARVATQYLTDLLLLADGDYLLVLAGYNHGPKAIKKVRDGQELPKVTANYLVYVLHLARRSNCAHFILGAVGPHTND